MRAITGIKTELAADIAGVSRNVVNLEQTMGTVVGSVKTLTSEVEQQKENVTNLQDKFSMLENELRETRDEVRVLKESREEVRLQQPKPPLSFASVIRNSSRPEVISGGNRQELEPAAGPTIRRWEEGRRQVGGDVREVGEEERIMAICEKSRRTVGLKRIDEKDIQRMFGEAMPYGGAKNRDEARDLAVKEFMHYELKIKPDDQETMIIEEMFERRSDHLDTVYVRFKHRSSLSKIYEKVKVLRKQSQLVTYIPREFQERFQALNVILKAVREEGGGSRTRVKIGQDDLMVSRKDKTIGAVYSNLEIDMTNLPPVCLTRPKVSMSGSPPPGRPGHREGEEEGEEVRKRRRSGLSSGTSPTNKASRQECDISNTESNEVEIDDDNESNDGEVNEDDEKNDSGAEKNVSSRVKTRAAAGYCGPPTISPVKEGQGLLSKPNLGEVREIESAVKGKIVKSGKLVSKGKNKVTV